jgi:hypothetical protein
MSNTTVLVADGQNQQLPHAQNAYPQHHGLAHIISSAMPWARHDQQGYPQGMLASHGRSSWSRAVPMRYDDGSQASAAMLPPYEDEAQTFSRASARSRPTRSVRARVARGDPWRRADRRVKHHYTSAQRFAEEPRPEPEFQRSAGHQRHASPRIVPGDERSVRKAKRAIESEWGHKRYPTLEDRPSRASRHAEVEAEAEEPPAHRHAPRQPGNHWDSI